MEQLALIAAIARVVKFIGCLLPWLVLVGLAINWICHHVHIQ